MTTAAAVAPDPGLADQAERRQHDGRQHDGQGHATSRPKREATDEETAMEEMTGADVLVHHLAECTDARAAVVVDGNADEIIARMMEAGWELSERVNHVAGKRIRFLKAPARA
jgi:hypothetical protein